MPTFGEQVYKIPFLLHFSLAGRFIKLNERSAQMSLLIENHVELASATPIRLFRLTLWIFSYNFACKKADMIYISDYSVDLYWTRKIIGLRTKFSYILFEVIR